MLEIGVFKHPEISISELKADPGRVNANLARHYGQARDVERKIAGEFTDVEPQAIEVFRVAAEIKACIVSNMLLKQNFQDEKALNEICREILAMREEIVDSVPREFKLKADMSLETYAKCAERARAYMQCSPETFPTILNYYDLRLDPKASK